MDSENGNICFNKQWWNRLKSLIIEYYKMCDSSHMRKYGTTLEDMLTEIKSVVLASINKWWNKLKSEVLTSNIEIYIYWNEGNIGMKLITMK